jgi:hypothetical protein
MGRRPASFTQAEVRRALRAAQLAQPGVRFSVEISGGVVRIVPVDPEAPRASPATEPEKPRALERKPKWVL